MLITKTLNCVSLFIYLFIYCGTWVCFYSTNLEAVVEALGLRLDLLGILQHPLIQHQCLTPLLHQHIRLGYEETPERGRRGRTTLRIHVCKDKKSKPQISDL